MAKSEGYERVFEIVRFAVPAAWSDWAVDRVVERILPADGDEPTTRRMPRGLSYEDRLAFYNNLAEEKDPWRGHD